MFKDILSEPDLTPAWITIYYDDRLQAIVGMGKDRVMVNRGCPFGYMLHCILTSYPEIERRYPPGALGFTLNGVPPEMTHPLNEGDTICFDAYENPFIRSIL